MKCYVRAPYDCVLSPTSIVEFEISSADCRALTKGIANAARNHGQQRRGKQDFLYIASGGVGNGGLISGGFHIYCVCNGVRG